MEYILTEIDFYDLADNKKLDCDIFDSKGNLLCKKGEILDAGRLLQLKYMSIYKKEFRNNNSMDQQDNNDNEVQKISNFTKELLLLAIKKQAIQITIEPHENNFEILLNYEDKPEEKIELEKNIYEPLLITLKQISDKFSRFLDIDKNFISELNIPVKLELKLSKNDFGEKINLKFLKSDEKKVVDLENHSLLKNNFLEFELNKGIFFIVEPEDINSNEVIYSLIKYANEKNLKTGLIEEKAKYYFNNTKHYELNYINNNDLRNLFDSLLSKQFNLFFIKDIDINNYKAELIKLSKRCPVIIYLNNNDLKNVEKVLYELTEEGNFADFRSSVNGIIVQRQIQKNCEFCKEQYELLEEEINRIFVWDGNTKVFAYKGKGCSECNNIGYVHTVPIQEFLLVNDRIKNIMGNFNFKEMLEDYFKEINYKDLKYDALKKILKGLTSIEEFYKLSKNK